jgi:hypothetical protein
MTEVTIVVATRDEGLVARSEVPPGRPYTDYQRWLRKDFFFSCAYCTMTEAEAQAIRFTIDHYEPRKVRPDLTNVYENLMYSCDECNSRKGDRCPPASARANGIRFFRPDHDLRRDHFRGSGERLEAESDIGKYSIETLDLNRKLLRTLRSIRDRLTGSREHIEGGVMALRRFPIDRLPPRVKAAAAQYINESLAIKAELENDIDLLLQNYAKSPLLEDDVDEEDRARALERKSWLKETQALYPGSWRGPRKKRKKRPRSRQRKK